MSGEDEEGHPQQPQQAKPAGAQAGAYPTEAKVPIPQGAYNPADYNNLNVGADIKELFKYIDR